MLAPALVFSARFKIMDSGGFTSGNRIFFRGLPRNLSFSFKNEIIPLLLGLTVLNWSGFEAFFLKGACDCKVEVEK